MTIRQLRYLIAVAEELHFGRAAARLHISQPALSHQIKKLEASLGVRVLDRDSRRVALTSPGEELVDGARVVLEAVDALERLAARHAADEAGQRLVVGYTGTAASRVLSAALDGLAARRPGVRVELRELNAERYDLLRSGALDVVLGRVGPDEMPDLRVRVLAREPRVAVLPADHPLAGRSSLRLGELRADGFITQPEALNPRFRQTWLAEQHAAGLEGRIVAEASSVTEFLSLVAAGRGVCLAPAAAADYLPWPGVRFVPVDGLPGTVTSAVTRRERPTTALQAFLAAAGEAAPRDGDGG